MKKISIIIPLVLFLFIGCAGVKDKPVVDRQQRFMEISLSFNTVSYPWVLGTAYPQMAVWVQSGDETPETVFVTQGAGEKKWWFASERPGALPVWDGIKTEEKDIKLDAVSGATPSGEVHTVFWQVPDKYNGKNISVFLEANVSFDYNDFYTKEENTPGYSDVNGQPSIVWRASFTVDEQPQEVTPKIIGHGNVLGSDTVLAPDLSNITTASDLFGYISVKYSPGS